MKESYTILPIPAGDVSGIASALYELGGMVVIHDPSGCNSTYNTHDELRWYDKESNIFISGLNMRDAVLGNDRKFISDIVEAAESLSLDQKSNAEAAGSDSKDAEYTRAAKPHFIAICNSPVPFLNGTDFSGICRIVEKETGIPTFYVKSNGMHDYITGVQEAYVSFVKKMLPGNELVQKSEDNERKKIVYKSSDCDSNENVVAEKKIACKSEDCGGAEKFARVNILGATPLDYGNHEAINSLKKLLENHGFEINAVWSIGTSFEEIMSTNNADVNLVISSTGIPLAKYLEKIYKMPYIIGAPVSYHFFEQSRMLAENDIAKSQREFEKNLLPTENGILSKILIEELQCAASHNLGYEKVPFSKIKSDSNKKISIIIGESVLSASIAAAIRMGQTDISGNVPVESCESHDAIVLCPYPYKSPVMRDEDFYFDGEEELVSILNGIREANPESKLEVIADPLYRPVIPAFCEFVDMPTLAISGRHFRSDFVNYFS